MVRPPRIYPVRHLNARVSLITAAVAACYAVTPAWAVNGADLQFRNDAAASAVTSGNLTTITTTVTRAIADAQRFNVGAAEAVKIFQPTTASSLLVNVLTPEPSSILGSVWSNGQFYLMNQAGIMVGAGARIDTAAFVASALKINDADFLAGRLSFQNTPGAGNVDIKNGAQITTPAGGSVYLVGANVTNEGIITTPGGETILAAGQTVNLLDTGTPGVKVEITGATGNVTNLGTILADAGRIGMAGVIVRNSGTLNASSVVNEGGRVFLKASQDTYVDGAGRIVATGTKGGKVEVLGDRVAVTDNASIDVSGTNGGGTILVGGDYQGKNAEVQNSRVTYFGPDATLKADALQDGDGGKVIVWGDDTTRAFGKISARGGAASGNGGFVETSGHRYLDVNGIRGVDTRADNGKTGTWLLDPDDITIVSGAYGGPVANPFDPGSQSTITDATINSGLTSSSVTIQTLAYGSSGGNGNITMTGATIAGSGNSLSLLAYGGTTATGNISVTGSSISGVATLTMIAGWDGTASPTEANVVANKGNLSISGSSLSAGIVNLYGGGDISFGNTAAAYGTAVTASSTMFVTGKNIAAYGSTVASAYYAGGTYYGAGVSLSSGSNQTIKADTTSGRIVLQGGSVNNASAYGSDAYGGSVVIKSGGTQTITAYGMGVYGGASGHDNTARIESYGSQVINVYGGGLTLKGGGSGSGDYNNSANIQHGQWLNNNVYQGSGNQDIFMLGYGAITLTGGNGSGTLGYYDSHCGSACTESNNHARIENLIGTQTIDFAAGGTLALYGGTVGSGNTAEIQNENTSLQKIYSSAGSTYYPSIYLAGGSGGTAVNGGNQAFATGVSVTTTSGLTTITLGAARGDLKVGDAVSGAGIPAGATIASITDSTHFELSASATASGSPTVTFTSPTKVYRSENSAGISAGNDSFSGTQQIYARGVSLNGGGNTTSYGGAYIGGGTSTLIVSYGSVSLTGGASNANDGTRDFATGAGIGNDEAANVTLAVYGGNLSLAGGTGTGGAAMIGSMRKGATVNIGTYYGGGYYGDITMTGNTGGVSIGSNWKTGDTTTTPADTSVTIKAEGSITGSGSNVRIGTFDAPLAAVGVAMTAGRNIALTNMKVGTDGAPGVGVVTMKAGMDFAGTAGSVYGGNLSLTGTSVYGASANLQAYGGSAATGSVTEDATSSVYGNSVTISATNNIDLNGKTSATGILTVSSGYYDTAQTQQTVNGGNISMADGASAYGGTSLSFKATAGSSLNASNGTIGLARVESPGATISADRQIYDNNGSGVANVLGNSLTLNSTYGGTSSGLAVSADVQMTGLTPWTISSTVSGSATYGGINVRNLGAIEPSTVTLTDQSTTSGKGTVVYRTANNVTNTANYILTSNYGGVRLISDGSITLGSLSTLKAGMLDANSRFVDIWGATGVTSSANIDYVDLAGRDLFIGSGGTMKMSHAVGGTYKPKNIGLYSSGAMYIYGGATLTATKDVGLWSGTSVNLGIDPSGVGSSATITAGSGSYGNVYIGSSGTGFNTYGSLTLTGSGAINAYGASVTANYSGGSGGDIYAGTSGDIVLNNGSSFNAGDDIFLVLTGTNSTLYLNQANTGSPSYMVSDTQTGLPSSISISFSNRSSDGVVIDGVTTTTSAAYGSGLFVTNHMTPATKGSGLNIAFGVVPTSTTSAAATAAVNEVVNTINNTTTNSSTTDSDSGSPTADIPPPTPPSTGGSGSLASLGSQTVGGGAGQFGGDTGTSGGSTSGSTGTTDTGGGTGSGGSGTTTDSGNGSGSTSGDGSKPAASSEDSKTSSSGDKNGGKDSKDGKDEKSKKDDKKTADSKEGDKKDDKSSKKPVGKCSA